MSFDPPRCSYSRFRDGRLVLFDADAPSVSVVRPWPDPRAWVKSAACPRWRPCRPALSIRDATTPDGKLRDRAPGARGVKLFLEPGGGGQLVFPFARAPEAGPVETAATLRIRAIGSWLAPVPAPVRAFVRNFPERHYHVLAMLARVPEAWNLRDNGALMMGLANSWIFTGRKSRETMRLARRWRPRRRRDIAGFLGFPPTEAAVRILARVPPASASLEALLYLRDALRRRPVAKSLAYCSRVNRGVIRVSSDPDLAAMTRPSLLDEIGRDRRQDARPRTAYTLQDCLRLTRLRGDRPPRVERMSALSRLHDALAREFDPPEALPAGPFPPPPLVGNADIVPLGDADALAAETRDMRNCVASYAWAVQAGRAGAYRVLAPERATLLVTRDNTGRWRLAEIRAFRNAVVEPETRRSVEAWWRDRVGVGAGEDLWCAGREGEGDDAGGELD